MVRAFDHVTIVVKELEKAKRFFGLLGFAVDKAVVISGGQFEAYMGVDGLEADHVTMVLAGSSPRAEVQILRYRRPKPSPDGNRDTLARLGFNHICFAVDDLAAEVARLRAGGVQFRNDMMEFHDRKLIFLRGPEGITVELAEWR
jgi:catechol 2,3-dioxygenase-like lactoylglutathione lyase family enzyme